MIFPQPRETIRGDNEIIPGQGQIELVPIVRFRIWLRAQPESTDHQVLEPAAQVVQTQVEETDTDSDSKVPDLIDSQGYIVN